MKITILFIVFCLGISAALGQVTAPVSNNDAPATKAQVEKLFGVMDIRQQTRNMMGSMQQQMQVMTNQTIKSRYPEITPAQMARMNRISSETLKDFPVDGMLDDMIPIYQKHLTQADVDAM